MGFLEVCLVNFLILFLVIAATNYFIYKFCKEKYSLPLGFGLGHFIFMFFIYIRMTFFPHFQEWGEYFIVIIDFPVSLLVLEMIPLYEKLTLIVKFGEALNPIFLYVVLGSIQYYFLGKLIENLCKILKKRGK